MFGGRGLLGVRTSTKGAADRGVKGGAINVVQISKRKGEEKDFRNNIQEGKESTPLKVAERLGYPHETAKVEMLPPVTKKKKGTRLKKKKKH